MEEELKYNVDLWEFPIKQPELRRAVSAKYDICPECGGSLDTGWECNSCDYDAMAEAKAVKNSDIFMMICYVDAMNKREACIDHLGTKLDT